MKYAVLTVKTLIVILLAHFIAYCLASVPVVWITSTKSDDLLFTYLIFYAFENDMWKVEQSKINIGILSVLEKVTNEVDQFAKNLIEQIKK